MRFTFCAVLIACLLGGDLAYAQTRIVGRWIVHTETNVVAIANSPDGGFAVRCLQGNLTLAIMVARTTYEEGETFEITWRVDRKPTVQTHDTAIGEQLARNANSDPLDQYDHCGCPRAGPRLRTDRTGRDATPWTFASSAMSSGNPSARTATR